ncbi:hypothetical protein ACFWPV_25635 [Streptomyces uncialis]|uniref:hypothetical protein n=1 Tax=Streptomyces uncialis TaxID=1048205 RepID=UPI003647E76B
MTDRIRSGNIPFETEEPDQTGAPPGVVVTNRDPLMMDHGDDGPCIEPSTLT